MRIGNIMLTLASLCTLQRPVYFVIIQGGLVSEKLSILLFGQQVHPQEIIAEDSCSHIDIKSLYTGMGFLGTLPYVCTMCIDNAFSYISSVSKIVPGNSGLECVVTSNIQRRNCSRRK
ncbi:hypothetical protein NPIL_134641 [Nephila pilipes]|uniref:Secreted protein n=1 Tax=Nephila pilipes TaxID=299642 RepID=A0A8X6NMS6_NEPPI|nr:hypothetical protein NPIL_134641 [Nephila pilipes]